MQTIYALLVGINDYPPPVRKLQGCLNDIRAIQLFLEARAEPAAREGGGGLEIKVLLDQDATRGAVIEAFRQHLGQAGPEDVALFYYSGHGSQEPAPEPFWDLEPDRLDETLVCYDSRSEGSWDIADKELSKLICEVARTGAHVAVVLDCCHSGSGTRNPGFAKTQVRRVPTDLRQRPIESFIVSVGEMATAGIPRNLATHSSGWDAAGRHVLLAACRDDEEAKEYQGGGAMRGAFSYFLGESLSTVGGGISYRSLFDRASALVRGQIQRQSPQLEASDPNDLNVPFLGGAILPVRRYFVANHEQGRWTIDAGAVHGLPAPTDDDAVELALFDYATKPEDLNDPNKAHAIARISETLGTTSVLKIVERAADPKLAPFKAVITRIPTPKLVVKLEGDPVGLDLARRALANSKFVREAAEGGAAQYRLIARSGTYLIAKTDDDRPLVGEVDSYTEGSAGQVIDRLEHIERWQTTKELKSASTDIGDNELDVEILQDGKPLTGVDIRLEYQPVGNGQWISPEVTIRLENKGKRTLFVGLLDLPETFGIFPMLEAVGHERLLPGEVKTVNGGKPIPVTIPPEFWERGVSEIKDVVKVIVATSEFDVRRLSQEDLDLPRPATRSAALDDLRVSGGSKPSGTLERLMERVQTRHARPEPPSRIDDWRTLEYSFTVVRPLRATRLDAGTGIKLFGGVRIEPHPALRVNEVRLMNMSTSSRAGGDWASLPRLLYDDPSVVQPFEFAPGRTVGSVLNVLELSGVNDASVVTPESPLLVVISRGLDTGEHVLPVAFDGEFYLPLGRSEPAGAETRVVLERLPIESEGRSLGGSLRILFMKVSSLAFGTAYPYPILAAAEVGEDFEVHYVADHDSVQELVAKANRIALFVHGIIGDTREMAASLKRSGVVERYDLVLTFDYENLQDPIPDTARALGDRLAAVGLGPNHGKHLAIVAHSMGGLVSRWFIEREGGNRVVQRLIMLGTPNGGSPWPNVVDWATTALAVGLNELSKVAWPAAVLAGLIQAASRAQVTLEQMMRDSEFLKELSRSPNPGIPYLLIAGKTSSIRANDEDETRMKKLEGLLRRLWTDRVKYELADMLFRGSDNDIAVSLDSMRHIPEGREPTCDVREVACDHLSYFRSPEGLRALATVL